MAVVVLGIASKDAFEVTGVDDEQMIQTLRPDRPHEPFCVGIRVGRPERCLEDLEAFGAKDLVEAGHVLRVAVTDEELWIDPSVGEDGGDVPRLLGDPGRVRVRSDPGDPDSLLRPTSMKNKT
jgi:hypothetical protein